MNRPVATKFMLLDWSVVLLLVHIAIQGGLVSAGPKWATAPDTGKA